MMEKKKSVDEAIDEVAAETSAGLSGVKESLARAQQSVDSARAVIQDGYGKARGKGQTAAERAKVYLEVAKLALGEARDKISALAASAREQAEILYANVKEQYEALMAKVKELYGQAKKKISEMDLKGKGDEIVEYVRTNPGKAILIAVAVGFVIGYATRPRD